MSPLDPSQYNRGMQYQPPGQQQLMQRYGPPPMRPRQQPMPRRSYGYQQRPGFGYAYGYGAPPPQYQSYGRQPQYPQQTPPTPPMWDQRGYERQAPPPKAQYGYAQQQPQAAGNRPDRWKGYDPQAAAAAAIERPTARAFYGYLGQPVPQVSNHDYTQSAFGGPYSGTPPPGFNVENAGRAFGQSLGSFFGQRQQPYRLGGGWLNGQPPSQEAVNSRMREWEAKPWDLREADPLAMFKNPVAME